MITLALTVNFNPAELITPLITLPLLSICHGYWLHLDAKTFGYAITKRYVQTCAD